MFFGMDPIYLLILGGAFLLSLLAGGYVKLRFARGQQVPLHAGITGAEVARRILRDQGITDVTVQEGEGFLSDHYSPMEKTLNLSPEVYNGVNAAAAGVAAHECGHALQHHVGSLSMWGRTVLVYPAYFGGNFGPWLVMIGAMLGLSHHAATHGYGYHAAGHGVGYYIALLGVAMFAVATLCSIIIVFNEFNASARARAVLLRLGITDGAEEDETVRGVLIAAGLTYLAAAIGSVAQLMYWLWRSGLLGGARDD